MPLDGHAYLQMQGWQGEGSGLRHGAISKPLAIPIKKSLGGVGKDRDEAFPFWDHVFASACKNISITVHSDSEDEQEHQTNAEPASILPRTGTGLISSLRPHAAQTPDHSSSATPEPDTTSNRNLTLRAISKREAVKARLYARFFRGPVLVSDDPVSVLDHTVTEAAVGDASAEPVRKKKRRVGGVGGVVQPSDEDRKRRKKEKKKRKEEKASREASWNVS